MFTVLRDAFRISVVPSDFKVVVDKFDVKKQNDLIDEYGLRAKYEGEDTVELHFSADDTQRALTSEKFNVNYWLAIFRTALGPELYSLIVKNTKNTNLEYSFADFLGLYSPLLRRLEVPAEPVYKTLKMTPSNPHPNFHALDQQFQIELQAIEAQLTNRLGPQPSNAQVIAINERSVEMARMFQEIKVYEKESVDAHKYNSDVAIFNAGVLAKYTSNLKTAEDQNYLADSVERFAYILVEEQLKRFRQANKNTGNVIRNAAAPVIVGMKPKPGPNPVHLFGNHIGDKLYELFDKAKNPEIYDPIKNEYFACLAELDDLVNKLVVIVTQAAALDNTLPEFTALDLSLNTARASQNVVKGYNAQFANLSLFTYDAVVFQGYMMVVEAQIKTARALPVDRQHLDFLRAHFGNVANPMRTENVDNIRTVTRFIAAVGPRIANPPFSTDANVILCMTNLQNVLAGIRALLPEIATDITNIGNATSVLDFTPIEQRLGASRVQTDDFTLRAQNEMSDLDKRIKLLQLEQDLAKIAANDAEIDTIETQFNGLPASVVKRNYQVYFESQQTLHKALLARFQTGTVLNFDPAFYNNRLNEVAYSDELLRLCKIAFRAVEIGTSNDLTGRGYFPASLVNAAQSYFRQAVAKDPDAEPNAIAMLVQKPPAAPAPAPPPVPAPAAAAAPAAPVRPAATQLQIDEAVQLQYDATQRLVDIQKGVAQVNVDLAKVATNPAVVAQVQKLLDKLTQLETNAQNRLDDVRALLSLPSSVAADFVNIPTFGIDSKTEAQEAADAVTQVATLAANFAVSEDRRRKLVAMRDRVLKHSAVVEDFVKYNESLIAKFTLDADVDDIRAVFVRVNQSYTTIDTILGDLDISKARFDTGFAAFKDSLLATKQACAMYTLFQCYTLYATFKNNVMQIQLDGLEARIKLLVETPDNDDAAMQQNQLQNSRQAIDVTKAQIKELRDKLNAIMPVKVFTTLHLEQLPAVNDSLRVLEGWYEEVFTAKLEMTYYERDFVKNSFAMILLFLEVYYPQLEVDNTAVLDIKPKVSREKLQVVQRFLAKTQAQIAQVDKMPNGSLKSKAMDTLNTHLNMLTQLEMEAPSISNVKMVNNFETRVDNITSPLVGLPYDAVAMDKYNAFRRQQNNLPMDASTRALFGDFSLMLDDINTQGERTGDVILPDLFTVAGYNLQMMYAQLDGLMTQIQDKANNLNLLDRQIGNIIKQTEDGVMALFLTNFIESLRSLVAMYHAMEPLLEPGEIALFTDHAQRLYDFLVANAAHKFDDVASKKLCFQTLKDLFTDMSAVTDRNFMQGKAAAGTADAARQAEFETYVLTLEADLAAVQTVLDDADFATNVGTAADLLTEAVWTSFRNEQIALIIKIRNYVLNDAVAIEFLTSLSDWQKNLAEYRLAAKFKGNTKVDTLFTDFESLLSTQIANIQNDSVIKVKLKQDEVRNEMLKNKLIPEIRTAADYKTYTEKHSDDDAKLSSIREMLTSRLPATLLSRETYKLETFLSVCTSKFAKDTKNVTLRNMFRSAIVLYLWNNKAKFAAGEPDPDAWKIHVVFLLYRRINLKQPSTVRYVDYSTTCLPFAELVEDVTKYTAVVRACGLPFNEFQQFLKLKDNRPVLENVLSFGDTAPGQAFWAKPVVTGKNDNQVVDMLLHFAKIMTKAYQQPSYRIDAGLYLDEANVDIVSIRGAGRNPRILATAGGYDAARSDAMDVVGDESRKKQPKSTAGNKTKKLRPFI